MGSESMLEIGCLPACAGEVGAAWEEDGAASSRGRKHDLTTEAKQAKRGRRPRTEAMPGIMDSGNCCLMNASSCSSRSGQVLNDMSKDGLEEAKWEVSNVEQQARRSQCSDFAKMEILVWRWLSENHTTQARRRVLCRLPVTPPASKSCDDNCPATANRAESCAFKAQRACFCG